MLEQIASAAKVQLTHVSYKGSGQQMNDALGGLVRGAVHQRKPGHPAACEGGTAAGAGGWRARAIAAEYENNGRIIQAGRIRAE